MTTATRAGVAPAVTADLPAAIRRSGILPPPHVDEIVARVRSGRYPAAPIALATRLVRGGKLTEYQARCLLHGRERDLVVGRYVILDRLGVGAMGRVYRARHRLMGRQVALKFIASRFQGRPGAAARFLREIRLIGRLDHPNIVRALDADRVGDVPYIVMEYVRGRDLGRLLQERGPLPAAEVASLAAQAALALDHAHRRGVVHRDVKPSNLLLADDGVLRLLDLGLATLLDHDDDDQEPFATAAGVAVGTIEYMSPEQAAGRPVDGRSDLYSLGCAMYHLLTGQVPFPEGSRVERLARRIREQPAPAAGLRPDLPPDLTAVLDRLLAIDPEARFATASDAAATLRALASATPVDESPTTVVPGFETPPDPSSGSLGPASAVPPAEPRPPAWPGLSGMRARGYPGLRILGVLLALLTAFLLGLAAAPFLGSR